eukprot:TRINITY_DN6054_c0_g1_i1.p1 TRINITY_DN6054_c0_g1~~TRINITY_DN6054_c0_g1_i1.p1  ORF type:complete len:376 (-),score=83.83 TRINITY_DN6054_c0_g1_i1:144-1271(-)
MEQGQDSQLPTEGRLQVAADLFKRGMALMQLQQQELDARSTALDEAHQLAEKERIERDAAASEALKQKEQESREQLEKERAEFADEKKAFEDMQAALKREFQDTSNVLTVDVGGTKFTTLRGTLRKHQDSMLAAMFSGLHPITKTAEGNAFIDRNPKYFAVILEFLRTDQLDVDHLSATELAALEREMDYFGFSIPKPSFSSKVVSYDQQQVVVQFLPSNLQSATWTLLFRASEHAFQASVFHQKCDGKANTVVLVKVKGNGSICGAYADVAWNSSGAYIPSNGAFLFSLVNTAGVPPCKFPVSSTQHGLYGSADYNATFGGAFDLCLVNNCGTTVGSYANLGHSYTGPNASHTLLAGAGASQWLVEEYEVWHLS